MGFIKFKFEEDEPEEPAFGSEPYDTSLDDTHADKSLFKKKTDDKVGFIIDWEKKLGFSQDPFADTILKPIEKFITGYVLEREKLNLFIIENKLFGTISAKPGYGKSSVLCWLGKQLSKYSRRIVVVHMQGNSLREGKGFLQELVEPLVSVMERMFFKKHLSMTAEELTEYAKKRLGNKKLIILVDDYHGISKQNFSILRNLMQNLSIRVIFAGKPHQIEAFKTHVRENEGKDVFKDSLRINLKGLEFPEAKELIMKRVEFFGGLGIEPFNEEYLQNIYKKSDGCPKTILNTCHDEAMKLSVDPEMVKKLKEESKHLDEMVYSSEGFEDVGNGYDKIEIVRNDNKGPIEFEEDEPEVDYDFKRSN